MATIKNNNSVRKNKTQPVVFVISIVLFFLQDILNTRTINPPNLFYLLMFLALIFCCYKERKLFKNIKHFAIGHFLVQYFILFLLFTGGGMSVFGGINTLISKGNTVESDFFRILKVFDGTVKSNPTIHIDFEDKEVTIFYESSRLTFDLAHNPSLCDKYYLYLEYKKGILGTYIVLSKSIVEK
jgi:hypothetical protein